MKKKKHHVSLNTVLSFSFSDSIIENMKRVIKIPFPYSYTEKENINIIRYIYFRFSIRHV